MQERMVSWGLIAQPFKLSRPRLRSQLALGAMFVVAVVLMMFASHLVDGGALRNLSDELAKVPADVKAEKMPFMVIVPAFVASELKSAFQIGFIVLIPFLIIDMVVASVLMSMGMMMVSPAMVSLPFKLMIFVLVDGWALLIGSLAQSFAG